MVGIFQGDGGHYVSGGWWALCFWGKVGIVFQLDGRYLVSGGWWAFFKEMVGIKFQGDGGHCVSGGR